MIVFLWAKSNTELFATDFLWDNMKGGHLCPIGTSYKGKNMPSDTTASFELMPKENMEKNHLKSSMNDKASN